MNASPEEKAADGFRSSPKAQYYLPFQCPSIVKPLKYIKKKEVEELPQSISRNERMFWNEYCLSKI